MATNEKQRQTHYNGKQSTRQAIIIVGPMISTACRLGLYGLACDLALLCHSRAFSNNEGASDG